MANWSQSHFLQSLGWATLNSFWQMALLWCLFAGFSYLFRLSPSGKYKFAVVSLLTGFGWFCFTLFYHYQNNSYSTLSFLDQPINASSGLLNILLLSASLAYLFLLIFPTYKLYRNWIYVKQIRKQGLVKADLGYRLFVQKVSARMGIGKKVVVYLSELVTSPVTVGYLKPIILLPIAALNNLNSHQVEAILLHELSHIRRFDYLINLMISIIHTILYFNPFVKMFMNTIEDERENCCDQLVLQFGYDKVGYASALLTLEKLSVRTNVLALGAAGKNRLLHRIQRIVGMENKRTWNLRQLAGLLTALFCILVFNSVLIIREKNENKISLAYENLANAFNFFDAGTSPAAPAVVVPEESNTHLAASYPSVKLNKETEKVQVNGSEELVELMPSGPTESLFRFVAADDIDLSLTKDQKQSVEATVAATKKILENLQWIEIEKAIADAMNANEKMRARQEYQKELEKTINWQNIEQNMKAQYEQLDWARINSNVYQALSAIKLDSLQRNYSRILVELEKINADISMSTRVAVTPLPDESIEEIQRTAAEIRKKVDSLEELRHPRKIIRL